MNIHACVIGLLGEDAVRHDIGAVAHQVHDRARFREEGTQWGFAGTVRKVNLRALSRNKVYLLMCVVESGRERCADFKPRPLSLWQANSTYKSKNAGGLVDGVNCCNDEEHGMKFLNVCSKNGRRYKRRICQITWGLETCGIIQELTGR